MNGRSSAWHVSSHGWHRKSGLAAMENRNPSETTWAGKEHGRKVPLCGFPSGTDLRRDALEKTLMNDSNGEKRKPLRVLKRAENEGDFGGEPTRLIATLDGNGGVPAAARAEQSHKPRISAANSVGAAAASATRRTSGDKENGGLMPLCPGTTQIRGMKRKTVGLRDSPPSDGHHGKKRLREEIGRQSDSVISPPSSDGGVAKNRMKILLMALGASNSECQPPGRPCWPLASNTALHREIAERSSHPERLSQAAEEKKNKPNSRSDSDSASLHRPALSLPATMPGKRKQTSSEGPKVHHGGKWSKIEGVKVSFKDKRADQRPAHVAEVGKEAGRCRSELIMKTHRHRPAALMEAQGMEGEIESRADNQVEETAHGKENFRSRDAGPRDEPTSDKEGMQKRVIHRFPLTSRKSGAESRGKPHGRDFGEGNEIGKLEGMVTIPRESPRDRSPSPKLRGQNLRREDDEESLGTTDIESEDEHITTSDEEEMYKYAMKPHRYAPSHSSLVSGRPSQIKMSNLVEEESNGTDKTDRSPSPKLRWQILRRDDDEESLGTTDTESEDAHISTSDEEEMYKYAMKPHRYVPSKTLDLRNLKASGEKAPAITSSAKQQMQERHERPRAQTAKGATKTQPKEASEGSNKDLKSTEVKKKRFMNLNNVSDVLGAPREESKEESSGSDKEVDPTHGFDDRLMTHPRLATSPGTVHCTAKESEGGMEDKMQSTNKYKSISSNDFQSHENTMKGHTGFKTSTRALELSVPDATKRPGQHHETGLPRHGSMREENSSRQKLEDRHVIRQSAKPGASRPTVRTIDQLYRRLAIKNSDFRPLTEHHSANEGNSASGNLAPLKREGRDVSFPVQDSTWEDHGHPRGTDSSVSNSKGRKDDFQASTFHFIPELVNVPTDSHLGCNRPSVGEVVVECLPAIEQMKAPDNAAMALGTQNLSAGPNFKAGMELGGSRGHDEERCHTSRQDWTSAMSPTGGVSTCTREKTSMEKQASPKLAEKKMDAGSTWTARAVNSTAPLAQRPPLPARGYDSHFEQSAGRNGLEEPSAELALLVTHSTKTRLASVSANPSTGSNQQERGTLSSLRDECVPFRNDAEGQEPQHEIAGITMQHRSWKALKATECLAKRRFAPGVQPLVGTGVPPAASGRIHNAHDLACTTSNCKSELGTISIHSTAGPQDPPRESSYSVGDERSGFQGTEFGLGRHDKLTSRAPRKSLHNLTRMKNAARSGVSIKRPANPRSKRNVDLSLRHYTGLSKVPLPKPRQKRGSKKLERERQTNTKNNSSLCKFMSVAAPSGLLRFCNPGILPRVRKMEHVHAILGAMIRASLSNQGEVVPPSEDPSRAPSEVRPDDSACHTLEPHHGGEPGQTSVQAQAQIAEERDSAQPISFEEGQTVGMDGSSESEVMPPPQCMDVPEEWTNPDQITSQADPANDQTIIPQAACENRALSLPESEVKNADSLQKQSTYARVNDQQDPGLVDDDTQDTHLQSGTASSPGAAGLAAQFLDLLKLDFQGRLSALERSRDRVRGMLQSSQFGGERNANQPINLPSTIPGDTDAFGSQQSVSSSVTTTQASKEVSSQYLDKFRSLLTNMDAKLGCEATRLETSLWEICQMLSFCPGGPDSYSKDAPVVGSDNKQPQRWPLPLEAIDMELGLAASAASILSTANFVKTAPGADNTTLR